MITGKGIAGYEGFYKIYPNGDILSERTKRKMSPVVNKKNGYVYVGLTDKNGVQKHFRLHRLVAQAFIPNPENKPEINHEDFNKQNNSTSNLKWCDRFYQNQHAATKPNRKWQKHRLGKVGKDNPMSKPVKVFSASGAEIGIYQSGILAAKATNSDQTKVSACCLGNRKTHNNLKFQFA